MNTKKQVLFLKISHVYGQIKFSGMCYKVSHIESKERKKKTGIRLFEKDKHLTSLSFDVASAHWKSVVSINSINTYSYVLNFSCHSCRTDKLT